MLGEFKRSIVAEYRTVQELTDENIYWNQYKTTSVISTEAHVRNVSLSVNKPYSVAATTSLKVNFYDAETGNVQRTLTRFKESAYGGTYRKDGALFAVGGAEKKVRIFDTLKATKSPLRIFKGHEGAIHHCLFLTNGDCASMSDDRSIRLWNVAGNDSDAPLVILNGHTDYIRTGHAFHNNPHLLVSGSYDHTIKVWDTRTGSHTMSLSDGKPVERVILFPNDQLVVSAAGTTVTVWDLSTSKQLVRVSNHHKTVTSLALARQSSRLITAGLDKHVKVYDTHTYKVVHSMAFPAPVLDVAISDDGKFMAAGLAGNGLLSILTKEETKPVDVYESKKKGPQYVPVEQLNTTQQMPTTVVRSKKEPNLARYDLFLKRFEYNRALDFVLNTYKTKPEVVMTVVRELSRRGALNNVLAGRDGKSLNSLLNFLINNIHQPQYFTPLLGIATLILDLYGDRVSVLERSTQNLMVSLANQLHQQVNILKSMTITNAQINILISACQNNRKRKIV